MKYNEFSKIEEVTGEVLKEKLTELIEDSAGAVASTLAICLIELPDGRQAQIGVYFQTDEDEVNL